jgi:hypothetical protein
MDPLFLFASIARTVGGVLAGGNLGSDKVREWAGYLNLGVTLAAVVGGTSSELALLDDQLKEAVAAGRGLTDAQRAAWKARSDAASAALEVAAGG